MLQLIRQMLQLASEVKSPIRSELANMNIQDVWLSQKHGQTDGLGNMVGIPGTMLAKSAGLPGDHGWDLVFDGSEPL